MIPAEEQKLQRAILALKAGDKPAARAIFSQALRENPTLEDAWVGLSFCAETIDQKKGCLKRALGINPGHSYARSALARIEKAQEATNSSLTPVMQNEPPVWANKPPKGNLIFVVFLGVICLVACLFASLVSSQFSGGLRAQPQLEPTHLVAAPNQPKAQNRILTNTGRPQFVEFYADW